MVVLPHARNGTCVTPDCSSECLRAFPSVPHLGVTLCHYEKARFRISCSVQWKIFLGSGTLSMPQVGQTLNVTLGGAGSGTLFMPQVGQTLNVTLGGAGSGTLSMPKVGQTLNVTLGGAGSGTLSMPQVGQTLNVTRWCRFRNVICRKWIDSAESFTLLIADSFY
ncbi:hypothetical protein J6590_039330 [Homalodisca vitripennis]|nr:hypothetical protein J6590_039330 [Homalodisca vitripennis]